MKKLKQRGRRNKKKQSELPQDAIAPLTSPNLTSGRVIRHDGADEKRFYEVDGEYYPSATTILDAYPMAYGLRDFLQSNTKAEAEQKKNDAAIQGSKIHHTIELLLSGRVVLPEGITDEQIAFLGLVERKLVRHCQEPFSEREDEMLKGFMQFWTDYKVKLDFSEMIVYSKKYKFAGTLDFMGEVTIPATKKEKEKKVNILLDWKTGKGLYPEYDLQVAAYLHAHKEMNKDRRKFQIGLLHLGVNKAGYRFKLIENPAKKFKEFLIIKSVWDIVNPDAQPKTYEFMAEYKVKL